MKEEKENNKNKKNLNNNNSNKNNNKENNNKEKNNKLLILPKTKVKTRLKKLFKNFTFDKALVVIFIFLIFFIATATLPSAFEVVGKALKNKNLNITKRITTSVKNLDKAYSGMLDFKSTFINNKGTYIDLNGLMARLMGQKTMNDRVILNNGNLAELRYSKFDPSMQIEQLTELYNRQKEKNKDFLFVLAPSQLSKYDNLIPEGLEKNEQTNYDGDNLLEGLNGNNVPYMDLREELNKEGISQKEAFFKTDHHWNIETGFWAYTKIMDRLSKDKTITKLDKDLLDLKNYNVEIKKDIFLGSSGKRVGKYFAGVDDFPVITPKKEFAFDVDILEKGIHKQGNFEEALCDVNKLKKDYFGLSTYGYYTGADDQRNIINKNSLENKKVLYIGDSFSRIPLPFLALNFKTIHKRDMRHLKENFEEYYEEFDPDIVIVLIGEFHIRGSLKDGFFHDNVTNE